nr:hypothetical protein [Rhizobium lentis]
MPGEIGKVRPGTGFGNERADIRGLIESAAKDGALGDETAADAKIQRDVEEAAVAGERPMRLESRGAIGAIVPIDGKPAAGPDLLGKLRER